MRKVFTLAIVSALMMSYSASAQGVKFGKRYMKQRMELRKQEAAKKAAAKAAKETQTLKANANNILDEYEERDEDRIYRYVYAYDKNKMRSSETIYLKEKTDGVWGEEKLYTVGRYTYEYDTQDRLSVKTVTYDENDLFDTYRVMVTYGDGVTEYKKYIWDDSDNKYRLNESWSYHDNGVLASYVEYNYDGDIETGSTFDANGVSTGYIFYGSYKMTFDGELNNPVVTYYHLDWNGDGTSTWNMEKQETYKYDPSNGRLVEYTLYDNYYDEYYDAKKYTYTYDELGRIIAIREYDEAGNDDETVGTDPEIDVNGDGVVDENDRPVYTAAKTSVTDDVEWELYYEEMYTYFNDDVYGVGNTWHDVFGMDGPLSRIDVTDYDGKSITVFTRDADGRLTSITFPSATNPEIDSKQTATIDENGQILKIEGTSAYNGDDMSYFSSMTTEYTWVDGQAVKAVMTDRYEDKTPDGVNSYESKNTTNYTYGDGKVKVTTYDEDSATPSSTTAIEELGTTRKVHHSINHGTYSEDETIARYVQTEDISFVRPNLKADVEGMTADSTIVVSVAGRVVCAYEGESNSGFGYLDNDDYYSSLLEYDNTAYYANTISGSTYFTIEHDGNETVCSDIKGLPIYILTDGRLTKEYKYYDISQDIGPVVPDEQQATAMRAASIPEGQAYDEITYVYDADGRLAGKTEVSVDENGTRTEEITLEYKYDEASGIASVEADAKVGVTLDGRRIGLSDNSAFSVCTVGGQVIAAGVTSYTFNSPGIYIINAGGITTKVAVK